MSESDKHDICKDCRKKERREKRKEWWKKHGPFIAFLGIAAGTAAVGAVLSEVCASDGCYSETDDEPEEEAYPVGEKYWNKERQRWEKDGLPYTFRVGWTDVRDGEHHEEEFSDIDQGYDVFEDKKKLWFTKEVTWDHVPPDDEEESDEE